MPNLDSNNSSTAPFNPAILRKPPIRVTQTSLSCVTKTTA
jgi:hypothetical protein